MAFDNVRIHSLRNGGSPIDGAREDLVANDVISLSLTNLTGITSFRWRIIGRPEYSVAGGGGANPWQLSTGSTASFTVDADSGGVHLDGTYVIECLLNEGSTTQTRITTELARLAPVTIPGVGPDRTLRKLGGFESLEDTLSIPSVVAGWAPMLNRWLELIRQVAAGAGGGFPGYGLAGNIAQIDVGDTQQAGGSTLVARADHQHALPVPAAPPDIATTGAAGASTKVAREDHTHKGVRSVNGQFGDVTVTTTVPSYGLAADLAQIDIGDAASAGALTAVPRADHQHAFPAPVAVTEVGAAGVIGASAKAAREDHVHKGVHSVNGLFGDVVVSTSPFPGYGLAGDLAVIDVGDAAVAGALTTVARADHQHALPAPAAPPDIAGAGAAGASGKVAREDHTHKGVRSVNGQFGDVTVTLGDPFPGYGLVGNITQIDVGDAASAGALATVARSDHQHALPAPAAPPDIASAGAAGASTKVAREDHTHKGVRSVNGLFGDVSISAGDPFPGYGLVGNISQIDVGDAASAGALTTVARADHQHALLAPAAPPDITTASSAGASAKVAREDHTHRGVRSVNGLFGDVSIAAGDPFPGYGLAGNITQIDVGDTAVAGSLTTVARIDHQHALPAPAFVAEVGAAPALGTGTRVAREDHVHRGVHSVNGQFGDVIIATNPTVAAWTGRMFFAVDYDGGNNANVGQSNVSMAAAGASPWKTIEYALTQIPLYGAGRDITLAIKPRAGGATYLKNDGVTPDALIINWLGYSHWEVRATTDFSDNAVDRQRVGGVIAAAGPGPGGVWTVSAGGTDNMDTTSATLPTGSPGILGHRVRMTSGVHLNKGIGIYDNTAGNVQLCYALSSTPAPGDTFLIEKPGVAVDHVQITAISEMGEVAQYPRIVGIRSTGAAGFWISEVPGSIEVSFCAVDGSSNRFFVSEIGDLEAFEGYTTPAGYIDNVGPCIRSEGRIDCFYVTQIFLYQAIALGPKINRVGWCQLGEIGFLGTVFRSGIECQSDGAGDANFAVGGTGHSGGRRMRIFSPASPANQGVRLLSSNCRLDFTTITNMGAVDAILATGTGQKLFLRDIIGLAGNLGYGMNLSLLNMSDVMIQSLGTPLVSGSNGDMLLHFSTNVVAKYTDLAQQVILDTTNRFQDGNTLSFTPSAPALVGNASGVAMGVGAAVAYVGGGSTDVLLADGDIDGYLTTSPAAGAPAYMTPAAGTVVADFLFAPLTGSLAYRSTTPGRLTTTPTTPGESAIGRVGAFQGSVSGHHYARVYIDVGADAEVHSYAVEPGGAIIAGEQVRVYHLGGGVGTVVGQTLPTSGSGMAHGWAGVAISSGSDGQQIRVARGGIRLVKLPALFFTPTAGMNLFLNDFGLCSPVYSGDPPINYPVGYIVDGSGYVSGSNQYVIAQIVPCVFDFVDNFKTVTQDVP
jgi:hypothetical protein